MIAARFQAPWSDAREPQAVRVRIEEVDGKSFEYAEQR